MSEFERALARLAPNATVNRDQVVFQAGVRSVQWPWMARALVSPIMLVAGLALGWMLRSPVQPEIRDFANPAVVLHEPDTDAVESHPESQPLGPSSYGMLKRHFAEGDWGAIMAFEQSPIPNAAIDATTLGDQRRKMLELFLD